MKIVAAIGVVLLILGYWIAAIPSSNLKIVACDVGQGDASIVMQKNIQVVIDGGPENRLVNCMGRYIPFWDNKIEMVVLSHAQEDHMSGLELLLERYEVGLLVWNELGVENEKFDSLVALVDGSDTKVLTPRQGDVVETGELRWKVLWPAVRLDDPQVLGESVVSADLDGSVADMEGVTGLLGWDINEASVVISVEYGGFMGLFTGDIGEEVEAVLVEEGVLTDLTYLKVPHHGSKHSSSQGFLETIKPEVVSIGSGKGNSYGHPHVDTLDRLEAVGALVLRTDEIGDVVVGSDGQSWWVE